jgi:hypothetical protein
MDVKHFLKYATAKLTGIPKDTFEEYTNPTFLAIIKRPILGLILAVIIFALPLIPYLINTIFGNSGKVFIVFWQIIIYIIFFLLIERLSWFKNI